MSEATPFDADIHQRLLAGDPIAPQELCERYLAEVVGRTAAAARRFHLAADEHEEVVFDAFISYIKRPQQYDGTKAALLPYLVMSASGDFSHMADKLRRHRSRTVQLDAVEFQLADRNGGQDGFEAAERADSTARLMSLVEAEFPDPIDRKLVALIIDGRTTTEECAAVLGITHLDRKEQKKMANQHKDRLKKRLLRMGEKLRDQP